MALQIKTSKNCYGKEIKFNEAYLEITNKITTKNKVIATITIFSDDKKEYKIDEYCNTFIIDISDTAINEYKQIYRQLKENKYMEAIDILEDGQSV